MGRTKHHSANACRHAYLVNPTLSLTPSDWSQIRFTQRMIHPTFSNRKELSVFDMCFAVRYQFMDVSDIPAILMKKARRGFNCEHVYTREQDSKRFQELEYKIQSLHGTKGEYVWVRSQELSDLIYLCCINASKRRELDNHIANDHLNINLEQLTLLTRCPIHYKYQKSCTCFTSCTMLEH
ncbi:unnamed protein product [Rotaria sp. Silwood2]|nr:unnamed protein product [Rotaria sp. Silwood2]CAF4282522.1 unnamed protein product [Rotaria sp. Silwood2]